MSDEEQLKSLSAKVNILLDRASRNNFHQQVTTLGILVSMAATFIVGMNFLVDSQTESTKEIINLNREHNESMQKEFTERLKVIDLKHDSLRDKVEDLRVAVHRGD